MNWVVDGAANRLIAVDLNLSERPVEILRAKVMQDMGARSLGYLVKMNISLINET